MVLKKEFKFYNVKTIETPTTIEIWEYLDEPVFHSLNIQDERVSEIDKCFNSEESELIEKNPASELYDSLKRKQKHYESMRWAIARLIDCNFDNNTKFMTLTFKENIQDITYSNYEFLKFIKRLNFNLNHVKKQKLKYLAVWEKQKRGAIHYHVIFFDFPYIKSNELQDVWGHGFVKINKVDVDSKENRGRYVSKYFSKDIDDKNYKQKAFFKSQNLNKPIETRIIKEDLYDFDGVEDVVYTKVYTRKIPQFNKKDINSVSFKDGLVRYTKIRKEKINYDDNNKRTVDKTRVRT